MSSTHNATYQEQASTPSTPGADKQKIYPKTDGFWYTVDDAGIETRISAPSGGSAPANATYITQTANATLSAEQALSTLATGLLQVTTTTGVLSAVDKTITTPGTTGNQTINKPAGRVNIAAAGTTITITNSLVTANSIILAVAATADATARVTNVVAASGSFVINTVATTAETAFNWAIIA